VRIITIGMFLLALLILLLNGCGAVGGGLIGLGLEEAGIVQRSPWRDQAATRKRAIKELAEERAAKKQQEEQEEQEEQQVSESQQSSEEQPARE